MNIFVTSFDPYIASQDLDDLRLNKMILETAQLLSHAYKVLFEDHHILYNSTHINHPCAIWSRQNIDHYSWLVSYFDCLAQEKRSRDIYRNKSNKILYHKSWRKLFELFYDKTIDINYAEIENGFFNFNCTAFKDEKDIRMAYKKCLIAKWDNDIKAPVWTKAESPRWYKK